MKRAHRAATPSRTADLAVQAVSRAQAVFGSGLVAAFVGGSRASGMHRDNSDIDAFVLVEGGDPQKEIEYAQALRRLHDINRLAFDHYGEIFDRATLESLLGFTEFIDQNFPQMKEAPCYRGNCLLSIYRKGRVVLNFLAAPKVHVLDPRGILPELERRAQCHLAVWRTDLPSPADVITLPPGTTQSRLLDQWKAEDGNSGGLDTPVGVDLRRWFGDDLHRRLARLALRRPLDTECIEALECPISPGAASRRFIYAAQCLSAPWP